MHDQAAAPALPEDRDGFRFRGGSTALDLTATLQARRTASPRELLATPQDLSRWLAVSGFASSASAAGPDDVETAHMLREAIYALAGDLSGGRLDEDALKTLNRIAARQAASPLLTAHGRIELNGPASALLASLAREAVRLFGGESAGRIRQCESPACSIFFVDTSRSNARRWCSMSACGNTAKVAALRRRRSSGQAAAS